MLRTLFITILLFPFTTLFAQSADSLFVKKTEVGWIILHKVKKNETILSLSRTYHVPPAVLGDFNNLPLYQELPVNSKIVIPVGAYNLNTSKPLPSGRTRPAYYKAESNEMIEKVASNSGVKATTIQDWNRLGGKAIKKGMTLLVGWLVYDDTDGSMSDNGKVAGGGQINAGGSKIQVTQGFPSGQRDDTLYVTGADTLKMPGSDTVAEVTEGERLYLEQTAEEINLVEEKGKATFFKRSGISSNGIFFAFHSMAKRGTIIKVHNPGTGKTVYAKVIGAVPTTASYHNAIIGLSSDARAELEVFDDKAWVQVSYAP